MTFQWVISLGQVFSTGAIILVVACFYFLFMRSYRARIFELEREIMTLRASIHRLHVLLNVAEEVEGDD